MCAQHKLKINKKYKNITHNIHFASIQMQVIFGIHN